MSRRAECEEYRSRRREQARKSNEGTRKVKRDRRKAPTIDCIDEDEEEEVNVTEKNELRVSYRRCVKKAGEGRGQLGRRPFKRVSLTDVLFKRIRPSTEEREQLLNQRHAACLNDKTAGVDPEENIFTPAHRLTELNPQRKDQPTKRRRVKKAALGHEDKNDEKNAGNIKSEGETENKVESDGGVTGKKPAGRSDRKSKTKKKKKVKSKSRSERIDESYSVCSYDSEVCLAGVALTSEDRKKIDEFRRQVQ